MTDHESIQARLAALTELERAQQSYAAGDTATARQALHACLNELPDHPDARALHARLNASDSDDETADNFQLRDWLVEAGAESVAAPDGEEELRKQLQHAIAVGQHERVVTLGEALTALDPTDHERIRAQVAESARTLVDRYDPEALDQAVGWADTWQRVGQDRTAKQRLRSIKERVTTLTYREQRLRDSLAQEQLDEILNAVHDIAGKPDRLSTTENLLDTAQATIDRLRREVREAKRELRLSIPDRIDQARRLLAHVMQSEPSAEHRALLADLEQRERATAELHRLLETAIDREHLTPLRDACFRLRTHSDHLTTSLALLERAESLLRRLDESFTRNEAAYQRGLEQDLEQAVVALTAIRRIDPDHPLCAHLPKLERQLAQLEELHLQIEDAIEHDDDALRQDLQRLMRCRLRLNHTGDVIARGKRRLVEADRRERRRRTLTVVITAVCLVAIAIPTAWWLFTRHAWHDLLTAPDHPDKIERLESFAGEPWNVFYAEAALREADALRQRLVTRAYEAALAPTNPTERREALLAFIEAHPDSTHVEAARAQRAEIAERRTDAAYARAREVTDPAARIAALRAFAANHVLEADDRTRVEEAIATAERERDDTAWQRANAPGDDRAERLRAYLAGTALGAHTAEAEAQLAAIAQREAERRARETERAQWSAVRDVDDPAERIAALERYLADDPPERYRSEARASLETTRRNLDRRRWARASDSAGTLTQRIDRLRAYLEREDVFRAEEHRAAARTMHTELVRRRARERWDAARTPGLTGARIERLEAFLTQYPDSPYRRDAEQELTRLQRELDFARYVEARSVLDPARRITALDAYLAETDTGNKTPEARDDLARALRELAAMNNDELADIDPDLLSRLPPERIARLPLAVQRTLEAASLGNLSAAAQARLPLEVFADLPVAERTRIARRPTWAGRSGVDRVGPWAVAMLPRDRELRLRLIQPGVAGDHRLAAAIWVGETEVSQAQWRAIAGRHPSRTRDGALPVHGIDSDDVDRFLERLAEHLDLDEDEAPQPRLPSPEEWRYLVHSAGTGAAETLAPATPAWIAAHAHLDAGEPAPVADLAADAWGLRGLYGNLSERCQEGVVLGGHHGLAPAAVGPDTAPEAVAEGDMRVGLRVVIPAE